MAEKHGSRELSEASASNDVQPTQSSASQGVSPPPTYAPVAFDEQINNHALPTDLWDRLAPEQAVALYKALQEQVDRADQRQAELAMKREANAEASRKRSIWIGGAVASLGFCCVTYLSASGNQVVAGGMAMFLATIISVSLGKRLT